MNASPPNGSGELFTDRLMTIDEGTVLWSVYAWDKPAELGGTESYIADIVMTSEMTTSVWGDQNMFFRHQDMKDDIEIHPEWKEYTERFGLF